MAEPAQATPIQSAKQQINKGFISGRITTQRRISTSTGPLFLTVVKLPSQSEFDHPATVELRSNHKLGENGEDWQGAVNLRGMPNSYDMTDKETGEKRRVISARNEYEVID